MKKLPFNTHIIEEIAGKVQGQIPLLIAVLISLTLGYFVKYFDNGYDYWLDEYFYKQEHGDDTCKLEQKLLRLRIYKYIVVTFTFISWVVVLVKFFNG